MSDTRDEDKLSERDESALASLLRLAGPRAPVPDETEARVYERVRRAWEEANPERSEDRVYATVRREWRRDGSRLRTGTRQRLLSLALVAAVALAVGLWIRPPADDSPLPAAAGIVVRAVGNTLATGTELHVGDTVRTDAGEGLSIRLADAESLRVDENTQVTIVAPNRFDLESGRVYADTRDRIYRDRGIVVETTFGVVRDVGTQFSVTAGPAANGVDVREGRVDVERAGHTLVAIAGERLRLADDGTPSIEPISPYDPYWDWATALAPSFDSDDKSVLDVLRWAARESGRELVFEDPDLRLAAMRVDLHGSVEGFDPLEAVASTLATTRFRHRIEADRIVIER